MSTCGTRVGYQRHQAEDTRPCLPCLDANSSAVKASRIRTGKTRGLNVSVEVLRETLTTGSCEALLAFLGEEVAEAVKNSPRSGSER